MAITKWSISGSEKSVPADTKTIKKAPDVPGLQVRQEETRGHSL
jgi:hypothetical protein